MTATLSSTSRGSSADSTTGAIGQQRPAGRTRLAWLRVGLILFSVGILGTAGWAVAGWSRNATDLANTNHFTVTPRNFTVSLREKGELKAAKSTDIMCKVEGRSTIISLIPEGTAVREGDLLVELASDQIDNRIQQDELKEANSITAFEAAKTELEIQRDKNASDIRKGELKIELAGLELTKYEKGVWGQTLKDAQIAIEQATINLQRRAEDFDAAEELYAKNFITKTEFQEDEFAFKRAGWDLEKSRDALVVLTEYTHKAELKRKQSDLDEALKECDRVKKNAEAEELKKVRSLEGKSKELDLIQTQLAKLRDQKKNCRITAPTKGFVVYYSGGGRHFMSSDNQVKEGATVHERQVLLSLPDTTKMMVVVRVHEAKTDKLHMGQRALIEVEGLPGKQFTGTVTKIAVLADTQNRWLNPDLKEYETEITLDPTDVPLKPGVTAYVDILVQEVRDALAVPVQTVYSKAGQRYVFRAERGKTVPAKVKLGAIGTVWAEVVEGLSSGDRVLRAFSDEHKHMIRDTVASSGPRGTPQRSYGQRQRGPKARPAAGNVSKDHNARSSGQGETPRRREHKKKKTQTRPGTP